MTTFSDAARKYAAKEGYNPAAASFDWNRACHAFDAGRASVPAATREPERLTDPDDPRIRDGALLAFETGETDGTHTTYRKRVDTREGTTGTVEWNRDVIRKGCIVRLIAEAPEPEPIPVVLGRVLNEWTDSVGDDCIDAREVEALTTRLHAAGLDIVRVQL